MMTAAAIEASQRRAARVAGWASLLSMAIVVFAHYRITSKLIVPGDASQTMQNIVAHETLFRAAVACNVAYCVGVVILLSAFYVVLSPVSRGVAWAAAACRLVFALTWMLVAIDFLGALRLGAGANYLQVIDPERLDALARVRLAGTSDAYYVGLPFYGLANTLCAWLWLKSRYVPRWLALSGVIASGWCVLSAFLYLVFPAFGTAVNLYTLDSPMAVFEIVISFWLLFRGLSPTTTPSV
jgi:hypothetical protein